MDQTTESESHERMVEVINQMGIHARPAAMIVRVANKYEAEVYVERDGELVNGKSIMGLMMLAAGQGSKLKFIASGSGAEQLLEEPRFLGNHGGSLRRLAAVGVTLATLRGTARVFGRQRRQGRLGGQSE